VIATAVLFVVLVLGLSTNGPGDPPIEIVAAPLLFPLLLLTAGLPIWVFAVLTRCHLRFTGEIAASAVRTTDGPVAEQTLSSAFSGPMPEEARHTKADNPEDGQRAAGSRQFGLQQMLVMMALIALALGLARAWFALTAPPGREGDTLGSVAIFLLSATGMVALSVVPCLAASMFVRDSTKRLGILSGYALGMPIAFVLVVALFYGGQSVDRRLFILMVLFAETILVILCVPRAIGCEFVRGSHRPL